MHHADQPLQESTPGDRFDPTRLKATRRVAPAAAITPAPCALPMTPTPAHVQPMPATVQPPLSRTEKTVLRLLLKGMTERRAADVLGRSHNTVHVHTRNIYRKLGVNSRKMLFQLAANQPHLVADDELRNAAA